MHYNHRYYSLRTFVGNSIYAITEGPGPVTINQRLSTYVLNNLTVSAVRFVRGTKHQLLEGQGPRGVVENSVVQL